MIDHHSSGMLRSANCCLVTEVSAPSSMTKQYLLSAFRQFVVPGILVASSLHAALRYSHDRTNLSQLCDISSYCVYYRKTTLFCLWTVQWLSHCAADLHPRNPMFDLDKCFVRVLFVLFCLYWFKDYCHRVTAQLQ
jgi:hypothetical protein